VERVRERKFQKKEGKADNGRQEQEGDRAEENPFKTRISSKRTSDKEKSKKRKPTKGERGTVALFGEERRGGRM